jgi:peptidyl-prolyl cis-trans isomerase SurA
LLLLAPAARGEVVEMIIAKVNGEIITQSEFQARQLAAAQASRVEPARVGAFLYENNARILQEAIDDLLLYQKAQDLGLRLPPAYLNEVIDSIRKENNISTEAEMREALEREGLTLDELKRNIERSILRRQVLSRELEPKVVVSETELRAEYEARKPEEYTRPATATLQEIYVKDEGGDARARAGELAARARAGEDFASLARVHSGSPSRAAGGDLGRLARGELHPDLEAAAFALEAGQVSDPIPSGDGYRILRLLEKTETSVVPFEEARDAIRDRLTQARFAKEYEAYVAELRQQATTELMVREVPLQLTGPVTEEGGLLDLLQAPEPAAAAEPAPPAPAPAPLPGVEDDEFVTTPQARPELVAPPSEGAAAPAPEDDERPAPPPQ